MDEQHKTLMTETLQEGLSRLRGRPVRVCQLEREFFPRSSSFWAERLRVQLDGDERLEVFFKDLNPEHQLLDARGARRGKAEPVRRELQMYQQVLGRQRFGTPELYAWRWDPQGGAFWLFLEDAGDSPLAWSPDFDLWVAAAKWAARFHAATRQLPAEQTGFLPVYGHAQYHDGVERIESMLPDLGAAYRPAVRRALDRYAGSSTVLTPYRTASSTANSSARTSSSAPAPSIDGLPWSTGSAPRGGRATSTW
jgi:hypothetical protein